MQQGLIYLPYCAHTLSSTTMGPLAIGIWGLMSQHTVLSLRLSAWLVLSTVAISAKAYLDRSLL